MTDMPRCETCKHWTGTPDHPYGPTSLVMNRHGQCRAIPQASDFHGLYGDAAPDEPAAVVTGEGWRECLATRADFGCTLHEPRESSPS